MGRHRAAPILSMASDLTDFMPYINKAVFDHERQLKWCNATMAYAVEYARDNGIGDTSDEVLDATEKGNLEGMKALLYGALRAATLAMTLKRFYDIYKPENLYQYMEAVGDGIRHYRPEDTGDNGEDLDESWPDTQSQVKKKKKKGRARTGADGTGLPGKSAD